MMGVMRSTTAINIEEAVNDDRVNEIIVAEELCALRDEVGRLARRKSQLELENAHLRRRMDELEGALKKVTDAFLGQFRVLERSVQNVREEVKGEPPRLAGTIAAETIRRVPGPP